ncbi:hypothetical protein N9L18_00550 [Candidatus Pacebacteria bacterium]|nr:hypothetical protein [Candidatus Paceibacterota bacterium]
MSDPSKNHPESWYNILTKMQVIDFFVYWLVINEFQKLADINLIDDCGKVLDLAHAFCIIEGLEKKAVNGLYPDVAEALEKIKKMMERFGYPKDAEITGSNACTYLRELPHNDEPIGFDGIIAAREALLEKA